MAEVETVSISAEFCRSLGMLLTQYLDGQRTFAELEAFIAGTDSGSSEDRELLKRFYHVLNHYDIDTDLRGQDSGYAAAISAKLRSIAASLTSASSVQIEQSIDAFWKR